MRAEVKEKDGREVYEPSGTLRAFLTKVAIGVCSFIAGVTLTLMFYPVIRP